MTHARAIGILTEKAGAKDARADRLILAARGHRRVEIAEALTVEARRHRSAAADLRAAAIALAGGDDV